MGTEHPITPLPLIPDVEESDADRYARAYIKTAQADPELTGFYESSEFALRSIGWALHGAGWMEPAEASKYRKGEADG